MRIRKTRPPLRQGINVRRLRIGVTTEIPDPVILIINRDHEHIRLFRSEGGERGKREGDE